jgi:hypothetical protein
MKLRMITYRKRQRVIKKAGYKCEECGNTENLQVHHISYDPEILICLCGNCHANKHPDLSRSLFFKVRKYPQYWPNISTGELARELNCHPRTINRHVKILGIPKYCLLSKEDKDKLISNIMKEGKMGNPEGRVYRPKTEVENQLIESLMATRVAEHAIERPSWTLYIDYLLNKETTEIVNRLQSRGIQMNQVAPPVNQQPNQTQQK